MRLSVLWATLALASMALAGCADGGGPAETTEDDTFEGLEGLEATDETGIIRGVVVDQAIVPVPDATVAIGELELTTTTTENGAFGFGDLDPGTYVITASKPGFVETQATAEVVAGEEQPPVVKILLEPDPKSLPFVDTLQFSGFVACSFTLGLLSLAACGVNPVSGLVGHEFLKEENFPEAPTFVQSEMVWTSTQNLGDSMSLSWTDPCHGPQRPVASAAGPSPLVTTFDNTTFEEMELAGCDLWLRVFSTGREGSDPIDEEVWNEPWRQTVYPTYNSTAPDPVKDGVQSAADTIPFGLGNNPMGEDCLEWAVLFASCFDWDGVGATVQQNFEIFTSVFHNFSPDEGWMFIEDGPHPAPDQ